MSWFRLRGATSWAESEKAWLEHEKRFYEAAQKIVDALIESKLPLSQYGKVFELAECMVMCSARIVRSDQPDESTVTEPSEAIPRQR
ncbi:MAG: hypothetical protein IJC61_02605 [Oscillospiraceae bacterium]|nr:hypothetical protein [Oscillospiraceae bacterium]